MHSVRAHWGRVHYLRGEEMDHSDRGNHEDSIGWIVESKGECALELLMQLQRRNWYVSSDAHELVRSLSPVSSLTTGNVKLALVTPTECGSSVCSTQSLMDVARARDLRLATPEIALLLALQHDPNTFGAPYVVVMHQPVHVKGRGHPRARILAISLERSTPGIVAPRAKSGSGWASDRKFIFRSRV